MEAEDDLALGRIYARQGRTKVALRHLSRALAKYSEGEGSGGKANRVKLDRLPPELLSYYGLCIAIVENRVRDALQFCLKAVEKDMLRTEYYLNLGKVYLKANQKARALETFKKGLEVTDQNGELVRELRKFGIRELPVLQLLPRGHFINRYLGLVRKKVVKRGRRRKG